MFFIKIFTRNFFLLIYRLFHMPNNKKKSIQKKPNYSRMKFEFKIEFNDLYLSMSWFKFGLSKKNSEKSLEIFSLDRDEVAV